MPDWIEKTGTRGRRVELPDVRAGHGSRLQCREAHRQIPPLRRVDRVRIAGSNRARGRRQRIDPLTLTAAHGIAGEARSDWRRVPRRAAAENALQRFERIAVLPDRERRRESGAKRFELGRVAQWIALEERIVGGKIKTWQQVRLKVVAEAVARDAKAMRPRGDNEIVVDRRRVESQQSDLVARVRRRVGFRVQLRLEHLIELELHRLRAETAEISGTRASGGEQKGVAHVGGGRIRERKPGLNRLPDSGKWPESGEECEKGWRCGDARLHALRLAHPRAVRERRAHQIGVAPIRILQRDKGSDVPRALKNSRKRELRIPVELRLPDARVRPRSRLLARVEIKLRDGRRKVVELITVADAVIQHEATDAQWRLERGRGVARVGLHLGAVEEPGRGIRRVSKRRLPLEVERLVVVDRQCGRPREPRRDVDRLCGDREVRKILVHEIAAGVLRARAAGRHVERPELFREGELRGDRRERLRDGERVLLVDGGVAGVVQIHVQAARLRKLLRVRPVESDGSRAAAVGPVARAYAAAHEAVEPPVAVLAIELVVSEIAILVAGTAAPIVRHQRIHVVVDVEVVAEIFNRPHVVGGSAHDVRHAEAGRDDPAATAGTHVLEDEGKPEHGNVAHIEHGRSRDKQRLADDLYFR